MAEIALRQIRAIIAVCEEGSFTRAAARENATQSGISQHVAAVERELGVKLFERSARGVTPTPAGQRYYKHCIEAVGQIARANAEVQAFASRVSGDLRIGLIPTLTRAALAPALEKFVAQYPDVRLHIVEGYSGALTEMVQNGELDFAAVPTTEGRVGLKTRLIARDREMLVSNVMRGLKPFAPVRLKDCGPLKIILPGRANVRRRNIEIYFETHGIEVESMIEMDAMIGTLQFVLRSDWVAILSGLICVRRYRAADRAGDFADRRSAADRRIRGDLAGAAHAVAAGAIVSAGLRGRDRAHPECVGRDHSAGGVSAARCGAPRGASACCLRAASSKLRLHSGFASRKNSMTKISRRALAGGGAAGLAGRSRRRQSRKPTSAAGAW